MTYLNIRVLGSGFSPLVAAWKTSTVEAVACVAAASTVLTTIVHGHQVHGCAHCGWEVWDDSPPVGHYQWIGYFEPVDPAWMRVFERAFSDAGPHDGQRHLAAVLDEQLFAYGLGKSVHVIPAMLPRSPHPLLD